jgi:hypothetical protein
MFSLVLGLGVTQLLGGVGNLIQVRQRVRPYALHSAWLAIVIAGHIHLWWSLWALRQVVVWTYPSFVYCLLGPAALVLSSHIIMPGEFYEEVHRGKFDLKQHYESNIRLFFGVFAVVLLWALLLEPLLGVRQLLVRFRLVQVVALVAVICCFLFRRRVVHWLAALTIIALWLFHLTVIRFQPV